MNSIHFESLNVDKRLDALYDALDGLLRAGHFIFINDLLKIVTKYASEIDIHALLTYATVSSWAKNKLSNRPEFIKVCKELHPGEELWKGLD